MANNPTLSHLPPWFNMVYTDKEGNLTQNSLLYNDEMWQALNFIVEMFFDGIRMPQKTTAQITAYGADANVPIGTMWFNTSLAKLQVKTAAATIETVTSV